MNGPGFDDVEDDIPIQADETHPQFFNVVTADFLPLGVHIGFLVDFPRNPLRFGVVEQVQDLDDIVNAHIVERPTGGDFFLDESRCAVAIHIWAAAAAEAGGARVILFSQQTLVNDITSRFSLGFKQQSRLDG